MRVSKQKAEENRKNVVDVAAALYRKHGLNGVGVADISKGAGMTHGGFYGQFPSGKEELVAEAVDRAFMDRQPLWDSTIEQLPKAEALAEIVKTYLSDEHCSSPNVGCPLAPLAADVSRQGLSVKSAFTRGVRKQLDALSKLSAGETPEARQEEAMKLLTNLVGAILLARAVDDEGLATGFLAAAHTTAGVQA